MSDANYFDRDKPIASPELLPIGGRCLAVIVTRSNNLGGDEGEETQWIGPSKTDFGGSKSVFDHCAVREAADSSRVCGTYPQRKRAVDFYLNADSSA